jgi:hypothetical protein
VSVVLKRGRFVLVVFVAVLGWVGATLSSTGAAAASRTAADAVGVDNPAVHMVEEMRGDVPVIVPDAPRSGRQALAAGGTGSSNFAGYFFRSPPGVLLAAIKVPTFVCPANSQSTATAIAELQGATGSGAYGVAETYLKFGCTNGAVTYSGSVLLSPASGGTINQSWTFTPAPGDVLVFKVSAPTTGDASVSVTDSTSKQSTEVSGPCSACSGQTGSVSVLGSSVPPFLPIPVFGRLNWSNVTVNGGTLQSVNPAKYNDVGGCGTILMTTSLIATNGTSFAVNFVAPSALTLRTTAFPEGSVGTAYSSSVSVTGGNPPYSFASAGPLPTGVALDHANGAVGGTPTVAGTSNFTLRVTDSSSPAHSCSARLAITVGSSVSPTSFTFGNDGDPIHSPHLAFLLVGDWWCSLSGAGQSSLCNGSQSSYNCTAGYSSCAAESSAIMSALLNLVADYNYPASGGYDSGLSAFGGSNGGVGPGLALRNYQGQSFAGPVDPSAATTADAKFGILQHTLNNFASGWGMFSQADVDNTVFVVLYPPTFSTTCNNPSFNQQTGPGGAALYGGFTFAAAYLVDLNYGLRNCTPPFLRSITAANFATFVASHEIDEAISSPGQRGWVVGPSGGQGQIDDPCNTRDRQGQTIEGTGPYWNFTRDLQGTVVAAYVNPNTQVCFPDVKTGVPPG